MVTASVQPHDRAQAEHAHLDGFVAKPFDPDDLLALIGVLAADGRI
jgi:CheY-like chemotaxis protein